MAEKFDVESPMVPKERYPQKENKKVNLRDLSILKENPDGNHVILHSNKRIYSQKNNK